MPPGLERAGFHTSAVTARIMTLAQTTEAKILVVDDDELELALLAARVVRLTVAAQMTGPRRCRKPRDSAKRAEGFPAPQAMPRRGSVLLRA